MSRISIIVPVYNAESCLRRCLDSVLAQTFTGWECVVVDDGSSDGCPAICDEYAGRDGRFVVIHQENKGPAVSRDIGIKRATGDLLTFVDSDDWLELNALELLYKKQQETGADVVLAGIRQLTNRGEQDCFFPEISDNDITVYFLLCKYKYLWGKLYKKRLFNCYDVPNTDILEDGISNIQIFTKTERSKIQILNSIIYNHDNRTLGLIDKLLRNTKNFNSYLEYPMVNSILILKNYINTDNDKQLSAFNFFMLSIGILPFLRLRNKINNNEIRYIYRNYYLGSKDINLIAFHNRIIMPLLNKSMLLGRIYILLLNIVQRIMNHFR